MNIPEVKLGIIAVSRDCFPIALSTSRRQNIVKAYGAGLYECPITVENEVDALKALEDVKNAGVNDRNRRGREGQNAYGRHEQRQG